MFGFSFGFSFGDFGLRLVEDRSTSRFSFGLRLVYVRSTFGLLLVCFRSTSGHRSIYVRPTFGLRYGFSSAFRSGYVKSTFNLRCLRSVYILSTYVFEQFFCASFVFLCAQRPVHVRSTSGVQFAFRSIYVWPTFGLRQDNVVLCFFLCAVFRSVLSPVFVRSC